MSQTNTTTNASAATTARKITRRQKRDALGLLQSRVVDASLAIRFLGFMEASAQSEVKGAKAGTVGKWMTVFVRCNDGEIRALPLRNKVSG